MQCIRTIGFVLTHVGVGIGRVRLWIGSIGFVLARVRIWIGLPDFVLTHVGLWIRRVRIWIGWCWICVEACWTLDCTGQTMDWQCLNCIPRVGLFAIVGDATEAFAKHQQAGRENGASFQ